MIASNLWIIISQTEQKMFCFSSPFPSHCCESQHPSYILHLGPCQRGSAPEEGMPCCCVSLRMLSCRVLPPSLKFWHWRSSLHHYNSSYSSHQIPSESQLANEDGNDTFLSFLSGQDPNNLPCCTQPFFQILLFCFCHGSPHQYYLHSLTFPCQAPHSTSPSLSLEQLPSCLWASLQHSWKWMLHFRIQVQKSMIWFGSVLQAATEGDRLRMRADLWGSRFPSHPSWGSFKNTAPNCTGCNEIIQTGILVWPSSHQTHTGVSLWSMMQQHMEKPEKTEVWRDTLV